MNAADFDTQFNRLTGHFRLPADADRTQVALDWLKAVEHYHIDALEIAVTAMIREAKDTYWPPLGKLLELIRGRMAGVEKTAHKCGTCDGTTWIESWPVMVQGRVYEMNARCPDCGIPAPVVKPHPGARPLTKVEYENWRTGRAYRDTMPDWAKAKKKPHTEKERIDGREELRAWINATRERLFGKDEDGAA